MTRVCRVTAAFVVAFLQACANTATFVTSTDIGFSADANTEQVQIGYGRAEFFQGPNYPDVGDAPAVVGFQGSDLDVFSPKIRQLYATGDAATLATAPGELKDCPPKLSDRRPDLPDMCAEQSGELKGERRALVFGTATIIGLKFGFIGNVPSSMKLGFHRQELSIIPMHQQVADSPDRYTPVLASLEMNVDTPTDVKSTGLRVRQFFATGAAARNLAKNDFVRNQFKILANVNVGEGVQATIDKALQTRKDNDADIEAYFKKDPNNFRKRRDDLLKYPTLEKRHFPSSFTGATDATSFISAIRQNPEYSNPIAAAARDLNK